MIQSDLKKWATLKQAEYIDEIIAQGSIRKAANKLNLNESTLRRAVKSVKKHAAIHGYTPEDDQAFVQSPLILKGKSTLYGSDGEKKLEWVKTSLNAQLATEAIEEWVDWLVKDAAGLSPIVEAPKNNNDDILCVIPIGDPHFGMYAWEKETGEPFNLKLAEKQTMGAIDRLVSLAPSSKVALLLELGDFFHADNNTARTPQSGAQLDVDKRWQHVLQIGLRTMVYSTQRLLEKHETVVVRIVKGNHDIHSSVALALALDAYFTNQPRVIIDLDPSVFWYYRFGKVLIGACHGDTTKSAQLPGIMATDRPKDWGNSQFRYWYHGHIHHQSVSEYPGCLVESFRTLAAKDAWHSSKGYRSGRDMKLLVLHKKYGEIERHRVDIAML